MATKMRKVLSCFVVFVILMSVVPVSVFATNNRDNTDKTSNRSNELEEAFPQKSVANEIMPFLTNKPNSSKAVAAQGDQIGECSSVVKFKGTATTDENKVECCICYGSYHSKVKIEELLSNPDNRLKIGDDYIVCYGDSPKSIKTGDKLEVYGEYYQTCGPFQSVYKIIAYNADYMEFDNDYYVKKISSTDQAEILEFTHTTGTVDPGSPGAAVVTIQNTGTTTRSFWVGLSYKKQGTSEWIDIDPQQSVDLYPGGSANVQFSWTLTTEPGTYDIFTKIWNGYDSSTRLMIPPSYDEQIDIGAFTIESTSQPEVEFIGVVTDLMYCYCVGHSTGYEIEIEEIVSDPSNVLENVPSIWIPCPCGSPADIESAGIGDRVKVLGVYSAPVREVHLEQSHHYLKKITSFDL